MEALLDPWRPEPLLGPPEQLAASLALGALRELDLTPKPGLVDRRDSGSHPDLTYAAMRVSVDLLPRYFERILQLSREGRPLADFVQAGIQAEARMTRAIRSNAHKGYIFLAGLVLMAAGRRPDRPRETVAELARTFFAGAAPDPRGLGGVRAEALAGLPSVFEYGWPAYRESLDAGQDPERSGIHLMALLMRRVEDSTAVRRCGRAGLERLRADGAALQRLLERGDDPEPWLGALNEDYRRIRLTMGGVADCLALTFAVEDASMRTGPGTPTET